MNRYGVILTKSACFLFVLTGNRNSRCSRQQIRQSASPDTGVAVVDMTQLGWEGHVSLPPGNFPFTIISERGNCTVDIGIAGEQSI